MMRQINPKGLKRKQMKKLTVILLGSLTKLSAFRSTLYTPLTTYQYDSIYPSVLSYSTVGHKLSFMSRYGAAG
jgi:hypothetical protein